MTDLNGIVSLLIACLEILLVINILIFSKRTHEDAIVILIIVLLLVYQLVEFAICNLNLTSSMMVYFAFAVISLLPPMAFTLVSYFYFYGKISRLIAFLPAIFFLVYYLLVISQFEVAKCTMLYAAYNYPYGFWYGTFYYGEILFSIGLIVYNIKNSVNRYGKKRDKILLFGFLIFTVPMIIAYFLYPFIVEIIESVLCKFAFLFALSLTFFSLEGRKRNE